MHSFGYVIQILTLLGEISPHLVKEPVAVILTPIADQFIISFFFFILSQHKVLVVVRRRVHVVFKHEAS